MSVKKIPFIASIIPTVAIAADGDSDRLYGEPASLVERGEAISRYDSSKLRLPIDTPGGHVAQQGINILLDEQETRDFLIDEKSYFEERGLKYDDIKAEPAIEALRLYANPSFQEALRTKNYTLLVRELTDHGFLGRDDLNNAISGFRAMIQGDEQIRDLIINDVRSVEGRQALVEGHNNSIVLSQQLQPQYICTAFSFCVAVANAAAVSNAVAVAVAYVWVGIDVFGAVQPLSDVDGPKVNDYRFGSIYMDDQNLQNKKEIAFAAASMISPKDIKSEIYQDIIESEINAFYQAAFEEGLISTQEDKEFLVKYMTELTLADLERR